MPLSSSRYSASFMVQFTPHPAQMVPSRCFSRLACVLALFRIFHSAIQASPQKVRLPIGTSSPQRRHSPRPLGPFGCNFWLTHPELLITRLGCRFLLMRPSDLFLLNLDPPGTRTAYKISKTLDNLLPGRSILLCTLGSIG